MEPRVTHLKQMIDQSLYVVDERAVATAILARAMTRHAVAAPEFRSDRREPIVRSFRRTRRARSFRLTNHPLGSDHHR